MTPEQIAEWIDAMIKRVVRERKEETARTETPLGDLNTEGNSK